MDFGALVASGALVAPGAFVAFALPAALADLSTRKPLGSSPSSLTSCAETTTAETSRTTSVVILCRFMIGNIIGP